MIQVLRGAFSAQWKDCRTHQLNFRSRNAPKEYVKPVVISSLVTVLHVSFLLVSERSFTIIFDCFVASIQGCHNT